MKWLVVELWVAMVDATINPLSSMESSVMVVAISSLRSSHRLQLINISHTVPESCIPRSITFMSRRREGVVDFMGLSSGPPNRTCPPPSSSKLNQECQGARVPRTFALAQPDLAGTIHVDFPLLPLALFKNLL